MPSAKTIDLKHLRYFIGIVDSKSLTRAAGLLHIAQPALSNRIAMLEEHLGVRLLIRSPTGVLPTREGEILYAGAKRILRELEIVIDQVCAKDDSPTGSVRFGCTGSSAYVITQPMIKEVLKQFPDIHFSFSEGSSIDIYRRLLSDDADIAFIFTDGAVPGVRSKPLVKESLFVAVPVSDRRFATGNEFYARDMAELDFVLATNRPYFGTAYVHRRFEEASIRLNVIAELDALDGLIQMVIAGKAATIVPWSVGHAMEESGKLRLIAVRDIDLSRTLSLCHRSDQPLTPAVNAISDLTCKLIEKLILGGHWRHAQVLTQHAADGASKLA